MRPYYQDAAVTIYHGDSLEVMKGLEDESVDLLWTDPPYGHSNNDGDLVASMNGLKGSTKKAPVPIANDDMDSMRRVVDGALVEGARVLKSDCCCCCCCCCGHSLTKILAASKGSIAVVAIGKSGCSGTSLLNTSATRKGSVSSVGIWQSGCFGPSLMLNAGAPCHLWSWGRMSRRRLAEAQKLPWA